jgi:4-hydroxythreonine-4-phosphate dehydrogenase
LALDAIERAAAGCLAGEFAAMVTAPISKESIRLAGSPFPGHTEILAERAGAARVTMMLVREWPPAPLRVALVTIHVPIRDVASLITEARVEETVVSVDTALRADWGVPAPRLAMLGLNPHAGDGGVIGDEEARVIAPALDRARAAGVDVEGPFPADAFFGRSSWQRFDAVVACYHDQGLAPFKALAQGAGVNVTCGLPFVRTSPDHGTAFDLAGQGRAEESSMLEAIRLAARLAAHRDGR